MPHDHVDHDHPHGHSHGLGGHSRAPADFGRAFAIGVALNAGCIAPELTVGLLSGPLAKLRLLLTDRTQEQLAAGSINPVQYPAYALSPAVAQ